MTKLLLESGMPRCLASIAAASTAGEGAERPGAMHSQALRNARELAGTRLADPPRFSQQLRRRAAVRPHE